MHTILYFILITREIIKHFYQSHFTIKQQFLVEFFVQASDLMIKVHGMAFHMVRDDLSYTYSSMRKRMDDSYS